MRVVADVSGSTLPLSTEQVRTTAVWCTDWRVCFAGHRERAEQAQLRHRHQDCGRAAHCSGVLGHQVGGSATVE